MNIRKLNRDNIFETVVMGAAALLTILCVVNLIQARSASDEMTQLSARLEALGPAPATDDEEEDGDASEKAADKAPGDDDVQRITQRNIFSPPKPGGFQGRLIGILGDAAIFQGNKQARVGEQIAGATVKEIGPDWVKLEFEDKPLTLNVFDPSKISGGGGGNDSTHSLLRMNN